MRGNADRIIQMAKKTSSSIKWPGKPLPRTFYDRPPTTVAQQLLNKILASADGRAGRSVEVEAYAGAIDPAAPTYRGKTHRNAVMFGPPGHMYVHFTYGIHWCCNCVSGPEGDGCGVLIRALEPLHGLAQMRTARLRTMADRDLCRGPGRLAQAMGIVGEYNGMAACASASASARIFPGAGACLAVVTCRARASNKADACNSRAFIVRAERNSACPSAPPRSSERWS